MATITEKKITLRYIRNYILDNNISEMVTLLLHPENFDDLELEHRATYGQGITVPFYFLRVLITEAHGSAALNRIRVVRDDGDRYQGDFDPKVRKDREFNALPAQDKKIYQCHHCGNIVTVDGKKVNPEIRTKQIGLLGQFKDRLSSTWIDICQECEAELQSEE